MRASERCDLLRPLFICVPANAWLPIFSNVLANSATCVGGVMCARWCLFGHYVSASLVLLIILEALVFLSSAYAGVSFQHLARRRGRAKVAATVLSHATFCAGHAGCHELHGTISAAPVAGLAIRALAAADDGCGGAGGNMLAADLVASTTGARTGLAMALVALTGSGLVSSFAVGTS
jgi:Tfp pilus assembly protein PilW